MVPKNRGRYLVLDMDPKLGLQTSLMDGVSARASVYLRAMADNPWSLGDKDDDTETEPLKVRVPVLLKAQLESIAAIETQVKKKKRHPKPAKKVSLSKLVGEIGERFVLGFCEEYGLDPKALPKAPPERGGTPSEELVGVALLVHAQREREERKKK